MATGMTRERLTDLHDAALDGLAPWLRLPLWADEDGRVWMADGDALVDDQGRMEPDVAAFVAEAVNWVDEHTETRLDGPGPEVI